LANDINYSEAEDKTRAMIFAVVVEDKSIEKKMAEKMD